MAGRGKGVLDEIGVLHKAVGVRHQVLEGMVGRVRIDFGIVVVIRELGKFEVLGIRCGI